jgi:regulator of protease activity HflC (stomatin/prohibitin superfamily)
MLKVIVAGVVASAALLFGVASCEKVGPGYAGIVVNNYGTQKGVQDYPVRTGRVFINPFTEDLYDYPVFMQRVSWAFTQGEDRSITFSSSEGAVMSADFALSYAFVIDSVPKVFITFRKDAESITNGFIRDVVRDEIGRHTSKMKAVDIFGAGKQALMDSVNASIKRVLSPKGILVDQLSMTSATRASNEVITSINGVLTAAQKANEAENKVRQSIAEGEQRVAAARADSTAAIARAAGQAAANRLLESSVTPLILRKMTIEKWDGALPKIGGPMGQTIIDLR